MSCPLCRARKARRACPALGQEICTVCCGTKRLVEIRCPPDCPYLATAREHPPAVALRRHQQDLAFLGRAMRDFNRQQAALFFLVSTTVRSHQPAVLQPLLDEDVAEAAAALASTFETAERGVIYEHRPPSVPAERLVSSLKTALTEASRNSPPAFGRDAALALRRVEEAAREAAGLKPGNRRAFLDLLGRALRNEEAGASQASDEAPARTASPLIVP